MDTSSAQQDEVDIGRDGADAVGGTEPRPRGFPPQPEAARQQDSDGSRPADGRQSMRRAVIDRDGIRSSLLRQGLPEREAVEGDAPEGAAAEQRGVDGSSFCAEGI